MTQEEMRTISDIVEKAVTRAIHNEKIKENRKKKNSPAYDLDDELIGHEEAAKLLGLSPKYLYRRDDIPFSYTGRKRIYSKKALFARIYR